MVKQFTKPLIVISKCLGFAACRYDGQIISFPLVKKLADYVDFITVCPEVEIELGVPRPPLKLVNVNNHINMIQPTTGRNVTDKMQNFSEDFLRKVSKQPVDAFILKTKSPSCGNMDCKFYLPENNNPIGKTDGLFTAKVKEIYPDIIIESEGRLSNFKIREHFLIKIFTLARFREIKKIAKISDLINFQSKNKFLLQAYNEQLMRKMGRLTANPDQLSLEEIKNKYENYLKQAFKQPARDTAIINVLTHIFGFFSRDLTKREKEFFLENLEKFRKQKIPLSVPVSILKSWIIKYNKEYLYNQTFFEPYPEELLEIKDSGKGR